MIHSKTSVGNNVRVWLLMQVQLINDKTWEAMDRLQEKMALENASEEEEGDGDALTEVNLFRVGDVLNQMSVKP